MPKKAPSGSVIVPLIVACALFMEQLDGSIIATALPGIAASLHADPLHLNLAITSYMFSLAVFIPLSGWAADRFGARTVFRFRPSSSSSPVRSAAVFRAICGTGRLAHPLQGAGGAMMVPVGRLPRDAAQARCRARSWSVRWRG